MAATAHRRGQAKVDALIAAQIAPDPFGMRRHIAVGHAGTDEIADLGKHPVLQRGGGPDQGDFLGAFDGLDPVERIGGINAFDPRLLQCRDDGMRQCAGTEQPHPPRARIAPSARRTPWSISRRRGSHWVTGRIHRWPRSYLENLPRNLTMLLKIHCP